MSDVVLASAWPEVVMEEKKVPRLLPAWNLHAQV
jgi:hypothetical protein